ncbi:hypothetical protein ACSBR1_022677 [Camellia fascicularis]
MEHSTGLIQVIIFEAADRDNIGGSAYGGQRSICYTPDLAKLEGCKQGEVVKLPSATNINWPIVLNVQFNGNYLSTQMDDTVVYITKTGMYDLFFISCDPKLKGLTMNGKTLWKNPDGYLPGRMTPLMKFYVIMSVAYALLSLIWFSQYMRFWKDTLQLQHCITVVIALGLFEITLWYFEYAHFNNRGTRPIGITTWVVTVGTIGRTLSRLLILCFNGLWCGASYSWWSYCEELLNITEYVGTINDVAGRAKVFLVLPDALLDAFLILWIFTSLSRTLEQLQAKRSSVKLDIYRKFSNALAITVIVSVAWIRYEVYFKVTDPFNEKWQGAWMITAFWDILAFALLCLICHLWAPITKLSTYHQREPTFPVDGNMPLFFTHLLYLLCSYTYSDVMEEELDDDEAQSLCRGTPKGDLSLVKQERKEKDVDSTDVSNLEDGPEED